MLAKSILIIIALFLNWEADFKEAQVIAQKNDRSIAIYFSGSDWCANCLRFRTLVLETSEFQEFAQKNLVLYNADFPRKKKNQLNSSIQQQNNELAERYNAESVFPKLVILDNRGVVLTEVNGFSVGMKSSEVVTYISNGISE